VHLRGTLHVHSILGRRNRGFLLCDVASLVMYSIDAHQRIVTKSLYRTALPFSIHNGFFSLPFSIFLSLSHWSFYSLFFYLPLARSAVISTVVAVPHWRVRMQQLCSTSVGRGGTCPCCRGCCPPPSPELTSPGSSHWSPAKVHQPHACPLAGINRTK
jgi:hypothetical protein